MGDAKYQQILKSFDPTIDQRAVTLLVFIFGSLKNNRKK
jgi:hypothetical protein